MSRIHFHKKLGFLLAIAGAAVVGGATTALVTAAIPSSTDGKIYACYRNNSNVVDAKGSLHVIDNEAGQTCSTQETPLNWAQSGKNTPLRAKTSDSDFTGATMVGWDLPGTNFSNTDFTGANITSANLASSNFTNANLIDTKAVNADFSGVNFTNAHFNSVRAAKTNFTDAIFTGTSTSIDADGANFTRANFRGSHVGIFAAHANFNNTDFSNAEIEGSIFEGSDLSVANVTGATWNKTYCPDGTYSNDNNGSTCIGHLVP